VLAEELPYGTEWLRADELRDDLALMEQPYSLAICGSSSVLSFTTRTRPANSRAISSSTGPSMRQGPHQGAQKSTRTGRPSAGPSTVEEKSEDVTGLTLLILVFLG
jgi:hypothetical protein